MARKILILGFTFIICLFAVGTGADDEPKKVMKFLAVMNLKCDKSITKEQCTFLTDVVIEELVKTGKYTVIDRANRDKILGEVGFQQTGCVEGSCTVEAGRILGVGKIVVGAIVKLGDMYAVNLQLINVETAAVEIAVREKCEKCKIGNLIETIASAARRLMGQAPLPTSSGVTTAPSGIKGGEMVKVPAGEFTMGSNSGDSDEKPVHRVYLDEFYIDKYEVTNEQYNQCVNVGPCSPNEKYDGFTAPQQPVIGVNWNQANTYCRWAKKRLPTEAEWEKAARGTDGRTYPWGEGIDCTKANYSECGHKKTKPVGAYPSGASPYGAMDMAGNVWEWCSDWYDKNFYSSSPSRNPMGPGSGKYRVLRDGSWNNDPLSLRSSDRFWGNPGSWDYYGGFRCARTP